MDNKMEAGFTNDGGNIYFLDPEKLVLYVDISKQWVLEVFPKFKGVSEKRYFLKSTGKGGLVLV